MRPETKKHLNELLRILGHASTMGAAMVFSTFCGVWFGYWLDKDVFDGATHPWLTIIFFLFGLAGGIRNLMLMSGRLRKKTDEWRREELKKIEAMKKETKEEMDGPSPPSSQWPKEQGLHRADPSHSKPREDAKVHGGARRDPATGQYVWDDED